MEIVDHLLQVFHRMTPLVGGFETADDAPQTLQNRDDAKAQIIEAAAKYRAMLLNLTAEQLEETLGMRGNSMARAAVALMPVNDIVHHNGQIAYIQMLLGDNETHRDLAALTQDH